MISKRIKLENNNKFYVWILTERDHVYIVEKIKSSIFQGWNAHTRDRNLTLIIITTYVENIVQVVRNGKGEEIYLNNLFEI